MKKAFFLTGLFLLGSGLYAEDMQVKTIAEGKKRNEEAFERTLEQTGWKTESAAKKSERDIPSTQPVRVSTSQPKSS